MGTHIPVAVVHVINIIIRHTFEETKQALHLKTQDFFVHWYFAICQRHLTSILFDPRMHHLIHDQTENNIVFDAHCLDAKNLSCQCKHIWIFFVHSPIHCLKINPTNKMY